MQHQIEQLRQRMVVAGQELEIINQSIETQVQQRNQALIDAETETEFKRIEQIDTDLSALKKDQELTQAKIAAIETEIERLSEEQKQAVKAEKVLVTKRLKAAAEADLERVTENARKALGELAAVLSTTNEVGLFAINVGNQAHKLVHGEGEDPFRQSALDWIESNSKAKEEQV